MLTSIINKSLNAANQKKFSDYTVVIGNNPGNGVDFVVDECCAQKLINSIVEEVSLSGGGSILLAEGCYSVSHSLLVMDNIELAGQGIDKTIVKVVDGAPDFAGHSGIVRFVKPRRFKDRRVINASICDMTIDGNRFKQNPDEFDGGKKFGIYAEGDGLLFERVRVTSCAGYGFDPHGSKRHGDIPSRDLLIQDCISENNGKDGFTLDRLNNSIMRNCVSRNNDRHGINVCTNSQNVELYGNKSYKNKKNGITLQHNSDFIKLENNDIYENDGTGLSVRGCDNIRVFKNEVTRNEEGGMKLRGVSNMVVYDNLIKYNYSDYLSVPEVNISDYHEEERINTKLIFQNNSLYSRRRKDVLKYAQKKGGNILSNDIQVVSNAFYTNSSACGITDLIRVKSENSIVESNQLIVSHHSISDKA